MPTYTYRCTNPDCLKEQDMFHGINAGGTPMCPECDGTMKKLMSNPPFRFMNPRGTMGVIDSTRGSREDISN